MKGKQRMGSTIKGLSPSYIDKIRDMLNNPHAKQIHFYEYDPSNELAGWMIKHSWYDTIDAINLNVHEIHTTQMGLLDSNLWRKGYRIYVHSNINNNPTVNELIYGERSEAFGKVMNFRFNLFHEWVQWFAMQFRREH